jgi:hypothetical protein
VGNRLDVPEEERTGRTGPSVTMVRMSSGGGSRAAGQARPPKGDVDGMLDLSDAQLTEKPTGRP